ncbi:MAG: hypothetical protein WBR15_02835 [Gammaproteobacteria bacterium]
MRDQSQKLLVEQSIMPAAIIATTNGASVDTAGFDAATIVFNFGVITDGTHTPSVEDSPDGSTWTPVASDFLEGTLAAVTSSSGGSAVQEVGYLGGNQYVRAVTTVAGATDGGVYGASVVLGHGQAQPVS